MEGTRSQLRMLQADVDQQILNSQTDPAVRPTHCCPLAMSNAPDRFALFILGEGEKRVEVQEETQIENAVSVILNKEDHTMGNMLRQ